MRTIFYDVSTSSLGVIDEEGVREFCSVKNRFFLKGTPAIAIALWSVERLSATALNVGMSEHLNTGKAPIQVLCSIKLQMLPYYWAPFVVFGDGR
ncbi:MAG: CHAT domain-containing protein [bacterium]|nr:CHAT domain-containing protein [bacterium]